MARPRNTIFYEKELPKDFLVSKPWLTDYNRHSKELVDYMVDHNAGSTAYHSTIRCLTELRIFLLNKEEGYSSLVAKQWFEGDVCKKEKGFLITLLRLADLYDYGNVQPLNAFPHALPYSKNLKEPWLNILESFLSTCNITSPYIIEIKNCVSRFLFWLQKHQIESPDKITFEILEEYLSTDQHKSDATASNYIHATGHILQHMADNGMCLFGLGWYPYFRRLGRVFKLCDFKTYEVDRLQQISRDVKCLSNEKLAKIIQSFLEEFESIGYSKSPCKMANFALHNLLLFLDMHSLRYSKAVADIWLEHYKKNCYENTSWKAIRRIFNLFDVYINTNVISYNTIFNEKPLLYMSLPLWYKEIIEEYIKLKTREGWSNSTIDMIRSSVTRFCSYLEKIGINNMSQINADILRDFNVTDPHDTAEGKNAYNSRIRKFIMFLERKEMVPNGIHNALLGKAAPKEKITVVLTEEEKAAIDSRLKNCVTATDLRNKAIIMLGLKMGLRASDIVTIKLSDINWSKQTLRVIQEKTDHEILLPIPTSVANDIYLYITQGRPNNKTYSSNLFVKHRIPYDGISRGRCAYTLEKILPERKVPGSAFHVTRKTYATDKLKKGVGKYELVELLGHTDTQSLEHYLLLDESRMRMCPLSLSETGLEMEGERYGTH